MAHSSRPPVGQKRVGPNSADRECQRDFIVEECCSKMMLFIIVCIQTDCSVEILERYCLIEILWRKIVEDL